jgi:hypothetical protein
MMMSDLRCPMCGKKNSADQDYCKYCQARLKPLLAGSDESNSPSDPYFAEAEHGASSDQSNDSSSDLPAWLQSLRSQHPSESDSEALPDWLGDTRTPQAEAPPEEDVPDWLRSLRGESSKEAEPLTGSGEAEIEPAQQEVPDWLSWMRDTSSQELEEPEASEEPAVQFGEAEQEWLGRIDSQSAPVMGSQAQAFNPFEEGSLDEPELDGEFPDSAAISDVPFIEPVSAEESEALPVGSGISDSDTPDEQPDAVPEWLASLSTAAIAADVLETTDELSGGEQPPTEVEEPGVAEGIPPAVIVGAVAALAQDEIAPEPDEITADFLDDLLEASPEIGGISENAAVPDTGVPDWLSGFDETGMSEESLLSTTGDRAVPLNLDWLEEERQTLDLAAGQDLPAAEMSPFDVQAESQPFFEGDLPEWLGEDAEIMPPGEPPLTPGEKGEDLVHADLPSWLESMRPIEAASLPGPVVEASDKQVEGTGPLAGLRSVLPSEFELGARSAPAAYTVKLQVSDTQKTHASIIEELIKSEGEAGEIPGRRHLGPQQLLLIGIFAVLLVALLWPLLTGSQAVELPVFTTEASEAFNAIGNLPATAPVLLAVDYEPGLSGEMEATASAVVDHLMIKGAYLALVSTAPSGPAQAERLVQGVNTRGGHTYQDANTYANLGYLPGGTVGIRSFAESPRRMMPFALDGTAIWEAGPLANVQKLSDFAMVLVITESPYTARSWIEQVKPLVGGKPLVMVVSAQAEPVVRPYFEGEPKVVQGIVAGLPGGASYESMIGRSNLARNYWDAYGIGISLIVILLLVGGVINIILHFTTGRQQAATGVNR